MLGKPSLSLVATSVANGRICKRSDPTNNTAEEVRSELRRVLTSDHFDTSERNRRFLEYVVEETLAGRHDRIKAYSIATIVFGRDDSFDPGLDPVVRMEARRLRRSLERFYLVEGQRGMMRITLPKGGYVPQFEKSDATASVPNQSQQAQCDPSILIAAFDADTEILVDFCNGLARRIAVNLSRVSKLALFMHLAGQESLRGSGSVARKPAVDFVLSGDAAVSHNVLKLTATLVHASSGKVIWAQSLDGDPAPQGFSDLRDKIANLVAVGVSEGVAVANLSNG